MIAIIIFILIIGYLGVGIILDNLRPPTGTAWGVTFAIRQARYLGLDWKETYRALLDDLAVRTIRIGAYWDEIEPAPGKFTWDDLDWQLREAERVGARVTLVVGRRLPHWPECHVPGWAKTLSEKEQQLRVLAQIRAVILHAKDSPTLVRWQVENEPLLNIFGICPPGDRAFLEQEISLVRSLDSSHPIMTTESGELSTWIRTADLVDVVGVSLYRVTWNRYFKNLYYPLTPAFYRRKAEVVNLLGPQVIITELQAEPWSGTPLAESSIEEMYQTMNPERVLRNVEFARRVGLSEAYLWGSEWWYWLKTQGRPEIWESLKPIFKE